MEGVTGHNLVLRCRGVKDDRRQVDLSRRAAEIRISPHGEAHRPRLMVDATQLLDMGTRRRQRCASPHLRPGAALPMRRRVPARGRSGDACATRCRVSCDITPTFVLPIGTACTSTCACVAAIHWCFPRAPTVLQAAIASRRKSVTPADCSDIVCRRWPRATVSSNTRAIAATVS
jgi:hypothetical protein